MRTASAVIAVAALALAQGCGTTNCEELADRICACLPEGTARDNCKKQVAQELKPAPGTDVQVFCGAKLATCPSPGADPTMCDRLNTCQGKVDCGLAYSCPPPPTTL